ncbi:hypothetical protein NY08_4503 [Rhodococcus sp. B7740]|nr:hypothetical protein NY08_4503 [Rhodococcus sp. B7740]
MLSYVAFVRGRTADIARSNAAVTNCRRRDSGRGNSLAEAVSWPACRYGGAETRALWSFEGSPMI